MTADQISLLALVVFVCIFVGCREDDPSLDHGSPHFVQCDESEADRVLLLSITIPDLLDGFQFQIPYRKANQGGNVFVGGGGTVLSADGPDGGLNGLIEIESSTDTSLSIHVDLHWSKSDTNGEFDESIHIAIAGPGQKQLSEGRKFEWEFVAP